MRFIRIGLVCAGLSGISVAGWVVASVRDASGNVSRHAHSGPAKLRSAKAKLCKFVCVAKPESGGNLCRCDAPPM